jgi:hypothetical protein
MWKKKIDIPDSVCSLEEGKKNNKKKRKENCPISLFFPKPFQVLFFLCG